jgi:hypothetical protein
MQFRPLVIEFNGNTTELAVMVHKSVSLTLTYFIYCYYLSTPVVIILSIILCGYGKWSSRLRLFENRVLVYLDLRGRKWQEAGENYTGATSWSIVDQKICSRGIDFVKFVFNPLFLLWTVGTQRDTFENRWPGVCYREPGPPLAVAWSLQPISHKNVDIDVFLALHRQLKKNQGK